MKSVLNGRPKLAAVIGQCAEVAGYLWEKGWAERNGGNLTYDITDLVDDEMRALPALGIPGAAAGDAEEAAPTAAGTPAAAAGVSEEAAPATAATLGAAAPTAAGTPAAAAEDAESEASAAVPTAAGAPESAAPAAIPIGSVLPHLKGRWFYVKGTGRRMRDLARDPMAGGCIIRITPDCAHYEMVADAPVMPTSELPSHLGLQNYLKGSGSSYKATLHTHPIELVALSHIRRFCSSEELTRTLWSMIPETLAFAPLGLGFIPFANPGTQELADATLKEISRYDVVLWEKHGTVAVGTDMMDAFDQTDVLNKAACIYKAACQMGTSPEGMSDAQMREIQELFHLPKTRVK